MDLWKAYPKEKPDRDLSTVRPDQNIPNDNRPSSKCSGGSTREKGRDIHSQNTLYKSGCIKQIQIYHDRAGELSLEFCSNPTVYSFAPLNVCMVIHGSIISAVVFYVFCLFG